MKNNSLAQSLLALFIAIGVFGDFIHCTAAFEGISAPHHGEQSIAPDHDHHDPNSEATCCDDQVEEPLSIFAPSPLGKTSLAAILPTPIFQVRLETIPPALLKVVQTKDPSEFNQQLFAINTIRLLL